jgi:RimJ/RimL family protein N-acetyltransferase
MEVFPDTTLAVDGLVLRPFEEGDIPAVVEACNDELTQRWLPLPWPYTEADGRQFCCEIAPRLWAEGDGVHLAIVTEAGELAGNVGLKRTDWRAHVTEIGYWAVPRHRGRGYMTAAVRALARWALEGRMQRVELRAATGNLASQRVAEKAGFVAEGVLRNAGFVHGGRVDLKVYSLTRADL